MKKNLAALCLLLSVSVALGQDLVKLIKNGDLAGIQKMEAKGKDIYETLLIPYRLPGDIESSNTQMHPMTYAAARNKIDIVKFYLEKKDTLLANGLWDETLAQTFIVSLSTRNDELIAMLFAHNPDLSASCESCRGHNAVMVAAAYGLDKWYFILKEKSNLYQLNDKGCSMLHIAIAGGSVAIIGDVVNSGKYDLNLADQSGFTPLDYAVLDSSEQNFTYLLTNGADITKATKIWFSVAESGHPEIFKTVFEKANPEHLFLYDENNEWPLHFSLGFNDTEMSLAMIGLMREVIEDKGVLSFDDLPLTQCEIHPLHWTIEWQNSTTFVAFIEFVSFINTKKEDPEYLVLPIYLERKAKKVFGSDFVSEVSEKNAISWY